MAIDIEKLAQMGSMAAGGGYAQAALGGAQTIYGLTQLPKAKAEFERAQAAAPSLDTPAQFYENYKNAYDSALAGMQNDAIQANLATSVQALQGAGGRALVGGLTQATNQSLSAQNQMLAQERQMRMAAGQQLAAAQERAIGRKEARSQQEIAYANQAYQAALGNIGSGLASAGEGLMYGISAGGGLNIGKQGGKEQGYKVATKKEFNEAVDQVSENALNMEDTVLETVPEEVDNVVFDDSYRKKYEADRLKKNAVPKAKGDIISKAKPELSTTYGMSLQGVAAPQSEPINSLSPKSAFGTPATPQLQPVFQQPNTQIPFQMLDPVGGSAIPLEYRNDQAMKQLEALQKGYNLVSQYNKYFNNGGMMTNGAFNHNTNPIDLMQNGQKVGEATGGEYILNPTQAAAIAKQSSFARKLFKKFEKNAKKKK